MKSNSFLNDNKYINKETLPYYANTNEEHLVLPVKGIVLEFPGLGGGSCLGGNMERESYSTFWAKRFGKKGIISAYLFPGPWSWGNKDAVRMADAVVSAVMEKYKQDFDIPVAVCGGSMGGVGALIYAADSRYNLCAVAAACPCVDVAGNISEVPEFARTYISAAAVYDTELKDALMKFSPMHRTDDMQKTSYFICSDGEDEVFPEGECDSFVEKLKSYGHRVEYHKQPGLHHGEFLTEVRERLHLSLENAILKSFEKQYNGHKTLSENIS